MRYSGSLWRVGPPATAALLLVGAGILPAVGLFAGPGDNAAAVRSTSQLSGFSTARSDVRTGGELWSNLTVSPAAARSVTVQYRRAATTQFRTASSGITTTHGHITVGLKPPAAGTWQFRVVIPATARATGLVSQMRTVVASGHATPTTISGFSTASATVSIGHSVTDDIVVTPRSARLVYVQARRPGSATFVTRQSARASSAGAFRAVYQPTAPGRWAFRLLLPATATALGTMSPARAVTAVDVTAPGPVTRLATTSSTNTSISLSWTNPKDSDFAGVMIRRATGSTPPSTAVAGSLVTNTARTAATFTDGGLQRATTYAYALFAHDSARNYARAATLTVATRDLDTTPPGPVTDLHTTSVARTSITLDWTDPSDTDFAGVIIRRAAGPTAPATASGGTSVAVLTAPATSFTDQGLSAGTEYSYSVFARDNVPNNANPATVSVTTPAAPTSGPPTASLAIRQYFGAESSKVTIGEEIGFDASGSFAADDANLVSGSVDYGDGSTPDTFGPGDFWGTLHSYTSLGATTVTLTVTDSAGRTDTATTTVTVFDQPTESLQVTSGPAQVGAPVTIALDAATPGGTRLDSYALYVTGAERFTLSANTAPPATQDITFTIPGTYTIKFRITDDAGGSPTPSELVIDVANAPGH